jgi:hypothetical protein
LITSSHRQVLTHRYLCCWILDRMIQMTCLQLKRKCLLLKLSFVCPLIFVHFSSVTIFSLGQNGLSVTALPTLALSLWENLSQLMLPVSEPPTT